MYSFDAGVKRETTRGLPGMYIIIKCVCQDWYGFGSTVWMQILSLLKRLHYSCVISTANAGINRSLRHGGAVILRNGRFASRVVAHLFLTLNGSRNEKLLYLPRVFSLILVNEVHQKKSGKRRKQQSTVKLPQIQINDSTWRDKGSGKARCDNETAFRYTKI